jgi:beta-N-acetylhexosaminidase
MTTNLSDLVGQSLMLSFAGPRLTPAVREALLEAIGRGQISEELFAATARRLDGLREAYAVGYVLPPFADPDPAYEHRALAIARRGVSIRDEQGLLPLPADTRLALIDCLLPRFSLAEEAAERATLLRELVEQVFPQVACVALQPEWDAAAEAQALESARQSAVVLLVTRNASFIHRQAQLARQLGELGPPLVHAAVRNPDAETIRAGAAATVLTYGDPPLSLRAMVDLISGRMAIENQEPKIEDGR